MCAATAEPRKGLEKFEERSGMAGFQSAREGVRAEGIAEWMERRRREVAARGPDAELAGRAAWAAGGIAGELPYAPRPGDVLALGALTMRQGRGSERGYPVAGGSTFRPVAGRTPTSWTPAQTQVRSVAYQPTSTAGRPTPPPARAAPRPTQEDEMTKLRREQAAFKDVVREESGRNWWMAIPALAPMAVPLLAEGAGLLAARVATSPIKNAPLNFAEREIGLAPKPAPRPTPPPQPATSKHGAKGRCSPGREGETRPRQWDVGGGDGGKSSSQPTVGIRASVPQGRSQLVGQSLGASRRRAQDCLGGMDGVPRSAQGSHTDTSRGYGREAQDRSARSGLCSPPRSTKVPHARG